MIKIENRNPEIGVHAVGKCADDVLLVVSLCLTPCLLGACQISPCRAFLTAPKVLIC